MPTHVYHTECGGFVPQPTLHNLPPSILHPRVADLLDFVLGQTFGAVGHVTGPFGILVEILIVLEGE